MLLESISTKIRGAVVSFPLNPLNLSQLLSMNLFRTLEKSLSFLMEATKIKGNSKTMLYIFYLSQLSMRC